MAIALLAAPAAQAAVTVSNVSAAQTPGTKQMVITYDVASDATNAVTVSLVVSNGVGVVASLSVSGDVGVSVPTGTGRTMVWDAGADWNGNVATLTYTVTADDGVVVPPPTEGDYMVIDLSGGMNAPSYPVTYLDAVPSGGWTDDHKTTKLVLRRIPAGTFTMGSFEDELEWYSNETQREVTMTQDYYMGVFQVTQKQWERVMGANPSALLGDARPVEQVSYFDIRANPNNSAISPNWPQSSQVHVNSFMGKLRAKTGLSTLDLPTEAQWERAARAGTTTALNSGNNLTAMELCPNMAEVGRYFYNRTDGKGGYSQHTTAGSYLPNSWGLYDMHGNVWEWCLDWYEAYHAATTDAAGAASGSSRVLRGGSWFNDAWHCRSAHRSNNAPGNRYRGIGFRLSRTLP